MIVGALMLLAAAAVQQEPSDLDAPVYRDEAFGVALPRPFPDWIFSPGAARGTTTVIFHPREAPLSAQLWGALVLTSFDGPVRLADLAERRLATTWQPMLGRTFQVASRDTLTVAGLPAVRLVMGGEVLRVAVDVEEYLLARGSDLLIVQFRYPRSLPRDSLAAGYARVLDGLIVRAAPDAGAPAPPPPAARPVPPETRDPDSAANRALDGSPWRARAYDAVVRFDAADVRLDFSVRIEAVNVGAAARDSLAFALPWPLLLDSARSATGGALELQPAADAVWVRLPSAVAPGGVAAVTVAFHAPADAALQPDIAVAPDGARVLDDWLPWVAPWADSTLAPLAVTRSRFTVRFDLPPAFTAVAAGRLTADFVTEGRRRMTWVAGFGPPPVPLFVVGRLARGAVRTSPLVTLRSWVAEDDAPGTAARTAAMAEVALDAWRFYTVAFGRLPFDDAYLLVPPLGRPGTEGTTLRLPPDAPDDSVRAAVARVWWGSTVRFAGSDAAWLADAFPAWSVLLYHQVNDPAADAQSRGDVGDRFGGPAAALEAMRRGAGDAAFREGLRRFFLDHRTLPATRADLLSCLGLAN